MLNAALGVSCVLVAVLLAFYLPLPLTASTAAGGILWWLFSSYRDVLEGSKMSGSSVKLNLSRSGLLDGYSPRAYPSGDGDAVYSPKGDRQHNRTIFDRSSDLFKSPPTRDIERNSTFSPSVRQSETHGRHNQSSSRLNDSSGYPGSPVSPRCSFRVSVNAQNETPVTSPSVSIMSRSRSKEYAPYSSENRVTSPLLPPGSYPWLIPHDRLSSKEKMAIPVKIKVSKPTSNFVVPAPEANEEPHKADTSKQIIQALKAMSRKRMHTTESDESVDDSTGAAMPKRRPMEFYHNLYASHLGGSAESSLAHSLPETPEDSLVDHRAANGVENQPASPAHHPNCSNQHLNNSAHNNAITVSNKRPRPANDSGNQTAKKRNNNEIICSLSSSLAILDPKLLQRSLKRKEVDKDVQLKRQKLKETSCVEVQTLPSPIPKDGQPKDKEDKGTATDKVIDDSTHDSSRNRSAITEKKVTGNMATALLKSAMIKFATSGELVTPDTSLTSLSGFGDTPLSKDSDSVPVATTETPKAAGFSFGATPTTSADKTDSAKTSSLFNFGGASTTAEAAATSTAATTLVSTSVTTQSSAQLSPQSSGFTLAGFPKPSNSNGLFKFGTGDAPKGDASKNEAKPTESSPVIKPNFTFGASKPGGFSFGATTSTATVPVTSVALSTAASTQSGFTLGQSTQPAQIASNMFGQSSQPTSTVPNMFGQSSTPATTATATITFGQTQPAQPPVSTVVSTPAATITFGQSSKPSTTGGAGQSSHTFGSSFGQTTQSTAAGGFSLSSTTPTATVTTQSATSSMPGGFSFTPSVSFSMGSSPTSSTASTSLAPIFSFGSSGFGQKQDSSKSLFGMPPRPATSAPSSTSSEPPKSYGGFNFTPSAAKEPPKSLFPSATPQNPEQKKPEGFQFGQNQAASKTFSFGSAAVATGPSKGPTTFPFSNNSTAAAPTPVTVTSTSMFNSPAQTGSNLFGSTSTPASSFGSTTPKTSLGFGTPATTASFGTPSSGFGTTPSFGSAAATQPSAFGASAAQTPAFGAATTQPSTFGSASVQGAFGSTAPSMGFAAPTTTAASGFGSSAPTFGASLAPAFGSTTPAFGSTPSAFGSSSGFPSGSTTFGTAQPTFGSVASSSGSTSTPAFGSSPVTTTTAQFGSGSFGTFGSSAAAPAFGSSAAAPAFGSSTTAPAFGATSSSTPGAAPAFATAQTTASPAAFNFSAPTSGGFNFTAAQSSGSMFQFGPSGAPAPQVGGQQPFTFSGAPSPAPGGFQNTMFSIGSGSSAPRSRTALRTRKK